LGKAQIYGWVKLINGIINLHLIIGFPITIQIKTNNEKPAQIKKIGCAVIWKGAGRFVPRSGCFVPG
jgi:hypothetical protein